MILNKGDTIGIVCPSHIASQERHAQSGRVLANLGYQVKIGANVYKNTYGYLASEQERADDFNAMIADSNVKMLLFGGGEGGNEIISLLDYDKIKRNPKFYCSFSDGTSILNAVHAMTDLPVYYGQGPGMFNDLRYYDYIHFLTNFTEEHTGEFVEFVKNKDWEILNGGNCEGTLIGGYTRNFALMLGNKYFKFDKEKKYVLFLEDHEKFSSIAKVSSYISHIEQHEFIGNVAGLIFGHYSENVPDDLLRRLERFGKKYDIPVVYTDDFGHGVNHAIFPIGGNARFNADNQTLSFTV
jgi:muramoyltetrapeptide carboxypeptidase